MPGKIKNMIWDKFTSSVSLFLGVYFHCIFLLYVCQSLILLCFSSRFFIFVFLSAFYVSYFYVLAFGVGLINDDDDDDLYNRWRIGTGL